MRKSDRGDDMMKRLLLSFVIFGLTISLLPIDRLSFAATRDNYEALPPFISSGAPPLVMLVMGRNHKLYYEAYNDASDLNEDDVLDIRYSPSTIDYYGYFDSYKCYTYASSLFSPHRTTTDKTCTAADNEWSGDFLNYVTMTRMDTMRKVLYGGHRSSDDPASTILERVFVPQDGHSWGKEYTSITVDGYDIEDYTPFAAPADGSGLRHLFASTTLDVDGDGDGSDELPLLRYALNNIHRIWEWVAKEGPVADNSIATAAGSHPGHPGDDTDPPDDADAHAEYEALVVAFANDTYLQTPALVPAGTTNIDDDGGYGDNYLAIFTGVLNVTTGGEYSIAVDGDDAVEVIIDGGEVDEQIVGYYGAHGADAGTSQFLTFNLSAGEHTLEYRMEEAGGDDSWYLYWKGPDSTDNDWEIIPAGDTSGISELTFNTYSLSVPASTIVDRVVRVKVCDVTVGLEGNCKQYPDGNYKPTGLLQRHGETDRMYFGLMTGSYEKNLSGGVLRKEVSSIKNEIATTTTGQLNAGVNGIIQTINKMRIYDWNYSGSYNGCGLITDRAMNEGECKDWGNPVAEMMYETQRYFAGKTSPTTEFEYSGTTADSNLGLPQITTWSDPYDSFARCSKPFMLVLSDINPTYDSDQLPGVASEFGDGITGDLTGLDVESLANVISAEESASGNTFIGQNTTDYNGACTEKDISGFGDIRGLCPEEPSKEGSYYSASVAYYGHDNDLNDADDEQKVSTYAVGLASPLPRIEIPINDQTITLVPFGKSVGGCMAGGFSADEGEFQPTNTIVDFFVESISPSSGTFRINYEDVEQGNDHDMDAIVRYEYVVNDDDTVTITLTSTYAAGCIIQHMGYVISGTTADGAYLEVRDEDTNSGDDPDYFLDTPPGAPPGGVWNDANALPLVTSRTFTPGTAAAAQLLKNPLWYAAKWGAFIDEEDDDGTLDGTPFNSDGSDREWDKDGDGIPDTYYYVTNPLRLEQQLNRSFASILNQASSGTAASVISNTRSGEGAIYQSVFYPSKTDDDGHTVSWAGQVHGFLMDAYGNMREDTNLNNQLDLIDDYLIVFNENGTANRYVDGDGNQKLELNILTCPSSTDPPLAPVCYDHAPLLYPVVNLDELNYLWSSQDWLNSTDLDANITTQRGISGTNYLTDANKRYVFTWVDTDQDSIVASTEVKDFVWPSTVPSVEELDDTDKIYPYLTLYPSFLDTPVAVSDLSSTDLDTFLIQQTARQINYIRGADYLVDGNPAPLNIGSSGDIAGTEMRSRLYDGKTWRLGDITYSTPTLVSRPAENFHLLYRDLSYVPFVAKYKNRRQMIYAGANDGMVHAFNGGFYNSVSKGFYTDSIYSDSSGPALGAELWAYVPYNLLPHLYWLTQTSYDEEAHVYYVDQKPRVFDAKIFDDEAICTTDMTDAGCIHPNGWGTVMVVGMRFGGGSIVTDMDKKDGATMPGVNDRTMKSAFMIFDITNPEAPPTLLAELAMPRMGFATSYPTVLVMADGDHDGSYENYNDGTPASGENRWFLAFGSGPADSSGNPGSVDAVTGVYDDTILDNAKSTQPGQFYLLDLVKLAVNNELYTLNSSGVLTPGLTNYAAYDANTFISDPVTVDFDLDYNADALYFGTISGDVGTWGGKLRRIVVDDHNDSDEDQNPVNWDDYSTGGDSVLLNAGQPITAAPAIAQDDNGKNWVFFGTGRYFTSSDKVDTSQQGYYGLKEPLDGSGYKTWATLVAADDLIDVTDFEVYTDQTVSGSTDTTWADMINTQSSEDGWYLDFSTGERNLGQAALIGGLLSFTTFTPAADICSAGGSSDLWGLYYKSGTAFYRGVFGTESETVAGEDKDRSLKKLT
ncbi:MAG: PilC/PilY family type IV pilus protein, partial [Spirochaetales bacterium]|nr:PilC/PilY family type IV pilus protein [Spirochaetales bacterium]